MRDYAVDREIDAAARSAHRKVKRERRPVLRLVGRDGNAFAILGAAVQAARRAGWPAERIRALTREATAGDYDHLLATMVRHFDVR